MDFAEFSDIETMGFATYCQKLQEQFSKDVQKQIVEANANSIVSVKGFASIAKEFIPGVSNVVNIGSLFIDAARLDKKELPNLISKDILSRISNKFNETLDQVGNYVNVIQGKLTTSQKELEIKQETINILKDELKQMNEAFLSEQTPVINKDLEIRRLRHKLTALTTQNKILTHSIKDLKEKLHQRVLSEERAKKTKATNASSKMDELHRIIDQLNNRNLQLQERLKEKGKKDFIEWNLSDYLADALGFSDVFSSLKTFFWGIENIYKALVIMGYAYTFYQSSHYYMKWLNTWNNPWHKVYAVSIFPVMLFCMIKLGKF